MNKWLSVLFFFFLGQVNAQDYKAYTSVKDRRAKGLDFMLEYPSSWSEVPPNRPNVVTNMLSNSGKEVLVILVTKMPAIPNARELAMGRELMGSEAGLAQMPGKNRFISGNAKTVIDGEPASTVKYSSVARVLDTDITMIGLSYTIFYKDYGITLMFQAGGNDEKSAGLRFTENEALFKRMAASFIVLTKYNK